MHDEPIRDARIAVMVRTCGWLMALAASLAGQDAALEVQASKPERGDVVRTFKVAGEVRPFEEVSVRSKVTGFVETIAVDRGSTVSKGDVLVELSIPEAVNTLAIMKHKATRTEIALRIARARVEEKVSEVAAAQAAEGAARSKLGARKVAQGFLTVTRDRYRNMIKDGSVTQQELDRAEMAASEANASLAMAEADVVLAKTGVTRPEKARERATQEVELAAEQIKMARAELARHETMMRYARITAPFAGVVVERAVHPGALVLGGSSSSNPTLLLRILRTDRVRVVIPLPEREVPHISVNTPVRITGAGIAGAPIDTTVTTMAGALTSSNRTMPVEIHSTDGRLLPGLSVYVTLDMEKHEGVLTVPSQALHFKKRKAFLWVIDGGKARLTSVSVGFNDLIRAEVKGIEPSTQVILSSRESLKADQPVRAAAASGAGR